MDICPHCNSKFRSARAAFHKEVGQVLRNIERAAAHVGSAKEETMEGFDFGEALRHLRSGVRVTRVGWNGPGQYIKLQVPDAKSKMDLPYLYISTVDGDLVPWIASQTDLLAEDWSEAGIMAKPA